MKSFIQCDYWNLLERIIIEAVDSVAPLKSVKISLTNKCKSLPPNVKMKLNRRKRLLRSDRLNNCSTNSLIIKGLNKEMLQAYCMCLSNLT